MSAETIFPSGEPGPIRSDQHWQFARPYPAHLPYVPYLPYLPYLAR
jgi:hypothetical protein